MSLIIPEQYTIIVDLVIKHKGCVFGGAVRDFLVGVIPNDIDVSIPDTQVQSFYDALTSLGFEPTFNNKFSKNGVIVDVSELPEDSELSVEINVTPDFDVNTLAWNGATLFNYWNPNYDISTILAHIDSKEAHNISANEIRISKMRNKGWLII